MSAIQTSGISFTNGGKPEREFLYPLLSLCVQAQLAISLAIRNTAVLFSHANGDYNPSPTPADASDGEWQAPSPRVALHVPAGGGERLEGCLAAVEPDPGRGGPAQRPPGALRRRPRDRHPRRPGPCGGPGPGPPPAPPPRPWPCG